MAQGWEKHQRRGPIAAEYSSPGPRYMVPGSTGQKKHDARKYMAPAYSFGIRHAKFTSDCSPGPGYLVQPNITRGGPDGTPHYSLYGRPKDALAFKTPGPGTYSPEKAGKSAKKSAPAYSLSSRTKGFRFDQSPAANAYSLPNILGGRAVGKDSAPCYSLTGRSKIGSFHEDLQKTPGPGTYRVTNPNQYRQNAPSYSMTARNQLPSDSTRKPGPGQHSPEKVVINKPQAPGFSFGIHHSQYTAPLICDPVD
ncbi:ciliary microtubule associated protein 1A-like isoform X1 [Glandiceps talaboti]